ncbi:MAG: DUF4124 domain-containing protein [Gammaproteobacteria bacterium]|nr:DUF4124 domain-containing protein [Gammaproteobacteria bacterium]
MKYNHTATSQERYMKKFLAVLVLVAAFCSAAQADVWKWVDASGKTHFVDTQTSIYTWVDDRGDVHYSDTPGHEDAIAVQLVWVSGGTLDDLQAGNQAGNDESGSGYAYPGETPEERAEREKAEEYYCKRATEIYESYVNAPRLYKTNDNGEREYLDKETAAATIAETRAQKDDLCQ